MGNKKENLPHLTENMLGTEYCLLPAATPVEPTAEEGMHSSAPGGYTDRVTATLGVGEARGTQASVITFIIHRKNPVCIVRDLSGHMYTAGT